MNSSFYNHACGKKLFFSSYLFHHILPKSCFLRVLHLQNIAYNDINSCHDVTLGVSLGGPVNTILGFGVTANFKMWKLEKRSAWIVTNIYGTWSSTGMKVGTYPCHLNLIFGWNNKTTWCYTKVLYFSCLTEPSIFERWLNNKTELKDLCVTLRLTSLFNPNIKLIMKLIYSNLCPSCFIQSCQLIWFLFD